MSCLGVRAAFAPGTLTGRLLGGAAREGASSLGLYGTVRYETGSRQQLQQAKPRRLAAKSRSVPSYLSPQVPVSASPQHDPLEPPGQEPARLPRSDHGWRACYHTDMGTSVWREAAAGLLIGAVTVELVGVEAGLHIEVALSPSHDHVPEPEREPVTYIVATSAAVSGTTTTGTMFAAGETIETGGTFVLRIGSAQYWDMVRFDDSPAGLLTAVGIGVINPTPGTGKPRPPSSG